MGEGVCQETLSNGSEDFKIHKVDSVPLNEADDVHFDAGNSNLSDVDSAPLNEAWEVNLNEFKQHYLFMQSLCEAAEHHNIAYCDMSKTVSADVLTKKDVSPLRLLSALEKGRLM